MQFIAIFFIIHHSRCCINMNILHTHIYLQFHFHSNFSNGPELLTELMFPRTLTRSRILKSLNERFSFLGRTSRVTPGTGDATEGPQPNPLPPRGHTHIRTSPHPGLDVKPPRGSPCCRPLGLKLPAVLMHVVYVRAVGRVDQTFGTPRPLFLMGKEREAGEWSEDPRVLESSREGFLG